MTLAPFRQGAGILDRSDRGKLQFTGEQARWFLNQLVTNEVEHVEPGHGADALLLTPNGRITAVMRLLVAGRSVFADVDPGQAPPLLDFFQGRVFTTRVEIADVTDGFGLVCVLGPAADRVVREAVAGLVEGESDQDRALGASLPSDDEHASTHFGSAALVRVVRPVRGLDLWVRRADAGKLIAALQAAGGERVTPEDYGALCVVEGLPRFRVDFDERFLPQEAALERAVHFNKGCYLGQEAVAMAQRGRIKRRLRHLGFVSGPATGSIRHEGEEAGAVTSAAAEDGTGFGIGAVRTAVPLGAEVDVVPGEGSPARAVVAELPGTSEGPKPPSARELRERLWGVPAPPKRSRS